MAEVGQIQTPTTLTLSGPQLLSRATFGVFDQWRDADRNRFSGAVAAIVERTLKSVVVVRRDGGDHLEVDLRDLETQESAIDRLERADPADPASNLEAAIEAPPTLFDE